MHITDLDENKLLELKEHFEISDNKLVTKKISGYGKFVTVTGNVLLSGGSRTQVGKERGGKTKYGKKGSFVFKDKQRLNFSNREIIWILRNGLIPEGKKVVTINGDVFDDRIENLKLVDKGKNGRPRGSLDKNKRSKRINDGYSKAHILQVEKLRDSGISERDISEKLGLSRDQIKSIAKKHLKRHLNMAEMMSKETYNLEDISSMRNGVCGIYVISFTGENFLKYYIGSSNCIRRRTMHHRKDMSENKHYNKDMNQAYRAPSCKVRVHVWKEVDESELLKEEGILINNHCKGSLLNKWSAVDKEDIKEYLDLAASKITPDRYIVTIDGCWIWRVTSKDGYGKDMTIKTFEQTKSFGRLSNGSRHIKPHRASFYKATGEYPELVRHKCGNKSCINPDHLEAGSHSENSKDTYNNKWYLFKIKWKEYNGDYVKLTEYFGYKADYTAKDGRRYCSRIRGIAKKLGLLE